MNNALKHATLRQLHIFVVAAESESFGHAANVLHLSQPAVSMQIRKLSELSGTALFEKCGRQVKLSDTGKMLLPHARKVIQVLREAGEDIDAVKGIQSQKVRIAMVTTARYFMPKLVAQFQQANPDIDITVSIANRQKVLEALEQNTVDMAIMGRPPSRLATEVGSFAEHPYAIIASPEHRFARRRKLSPINIIDDTFLAREPGSGTRMLMDHYFKKNRLVVKNVQEIASNESIKQAVMANMGIAFLSMHTVGLERKTGDFVVLKVGGLPIRREWYVVRMKGREGGVIGGLRGFIEGEGDRFVRGVFGG